MIDFFLHIPKTAGRAINQILLENYEPSQRLPVQQRGLFRQTERKAEPMWHSETWRPVSVFGLPRERFLIFGHLPYDGISKVRDRFRVFSIFRDPVDRLISEYNHASQSKHHHLYSEISENNIKFEDYCLSGRFLTGDNLQTRFLAGIHSLRSFGEVSEDDFSAASRNMKELDGVGLQNKFEDTVRIFSYLFGWRSNTLSFGRVGAARGGIRRADLDTSTVDAIYDLNRYDRSLFQEAEVEFAHRKMLYELLMKSNHQDIRAIYCKMRKLFR